MEFRTEINPGPSLNRISHETKVLFTGSCFAENIGSYLKEFLFPVKINPFGVVYNPLSVLNTLGILLDGNKFGEDDLEYRDELWFSWDHHSSFSHPDKGECLRKINLEIESSSKHLKQSRFLVITFGTAWVYRLKESGKIVSNCHKVPDSAFDRILLKPEDIIQSWENFLDEIFTLFPDLTVIFTISPVRHWKEGAHGNQLSKAVLLLAVDELCNKFPDKTEYFPAYEILLDDLRDYRFYADDLLHPGTQALEYIRDKFGQTYFDGKTIELIREIKKLIQAKNHKVFNKDSESYVKFKDAQLKLISNISLLYPFLDLTEFREYFT